MYEGGSIEKRKYPRLDCSMPVQYRRVGVLDGESSGALTKNVSTGGTCIVTEEFIPANSRVVMVLSVPFAAQRIKSLCKVVWTKRFATLSRYDIGIEFIEMTDKGKREMTMFVKSKVS